MKRSISLARPGCISQRAFPLLKVLYVWRLTFVRRIYKWAIPYSSLSTSNVQLDRDLRSVPESRATPVPVIRTVQALSHLIPFSSSGTVCSNDVPPGSHVTVRLSHNSAGLVNNLY
jgi:hypothetical protein